MEPIVSILVFVLALALIVWLCVYIIQKTLPADVHMPAMAVVGVLALIAVLYRAAPYFGLH
jgi:uncharacterized membrane-anchored protein